VTRVEYLAHMLIQPFYLVPHRVGEFINFLLNKLVRLLTFAEEPLRRPDWCLHLRSGHGGRDNTRFEAETEAADAKFEFKVVLYVHNEVRRAKLQLFCVYFM
jgi:hypothetical protein